MSLIPVIDFGQYLNDNDGKDPNQVEVLQKLGDEVKKAFETVGFCYIKNHGVDAALLEKHFRLARMFFTGPSEVKETFSRNGSKYGWVALETEQLAQNRPAGYRESFKYHVQADVKNVHAEARDFYESIKEMTQQCSQFAKRILEVLSVGLGLDQEFMEKAHSLIGMNDNQSFLKSIYYPPIPDDSLIKPNQIRIGEHSDFGALTILFQDNQGGLEVEIPGQGFVPATPIPGTAVVNIGDLMQRWSADKLIATKHRVVIPEAEVKRRASKQSLAFFVHPNEDVIIKSLDGSGKYDEISALDYVNKRTAEIYEDLLLLEKDM